MSSTQQQPSARRDAAVLIVEDDAIIATMMEEMLLELGYSEIRMASSVEDALEILGKAPPRLALVDASLRDKLATEVVEQLTRAGIPFIVTSGSDLGQLPAPFHSGVMLPKPFSLERLRHAVHKSGTPL